MTVTVGRWSSLKEKAPWMTVPSVENRLSGHRDPDMDQPLLILLLFPHCPLALNHYPSFLGSKAWSMVCLPLILFGKIDSYLTQ